MHLSGVYHSYLKILFILVFVVVLAFISVENCLHGNHYNHVHFAKLKVAQSFDGF